MQLQWVDRRDWTMVDWQTIMSDGQLEAKARELLKRAAKAGLARDWDRYNELNSALFVVRSEQRRRKQLHENRGER